MDTKFYFQVRDLRTGTVIGWKGKVDPLLYIPVAGQIADFIKQYSALKDQDIGMAVELFDVEKNTTERFAILYWFQNSANANDQFYFVKEMPLSNLEVMEILYINKKPKEGSKNEL